jgi:hypothetical protein
MAETQTLDQYTDSTDTDADKSERDSGDGNSKYPITSHGCTLYGSPACPECGDIGSYQGAGSTGVSNWVGRSYSRYYCEPCDRSFKVHAAANETPTI